ncbi:hypothetical protein HPB49_009460 [Dermacentor silvarum]|uniref:Uncharacterized protein n=2 Tax=Dermacentor silvarum TaxID=543639 RepID=A0ACB8D488_DERSI|nr:hypothetical protein HPB49_009398 [Dermacentor silvarum]KAH7959227.1 hypothetical protein HPB49_009460 [Dermacentor silvarum]
MFALVRFIDDDMDKRQYVIPVHDIEEFDPVDENDFSNKTAYRAKWHDPDNDINDGTYTIQILRLAVKHLLEEMLETRECLAYWGRTNNQDIAVAAHGVLRVLSEKIQDVKKKLKLGKE